MFKLWLSPVAVAGKPARFPPKALQPRPGIREGPRRQGGESRAPILEGRIEQDLPTPNCSSSGDPTVAQVGVWIQQAQAKGQGKDKGKDGQGQSSRKVLSPEKECTRLSRL